MAARKAIRDEVRLDMSNEKLRKFLRDFLDELGSHPDGGRWTIIELAKATGVSRSSIYNWVEGRSPPSAASLRQFASGLATLKAEVESDPELAKQVLPGLLRELQLTFGQPASFSARKIRYGFVPYAPICGIPPSVAKQNAEGGAEWTFLGTLLDQMQRAQGLDIQGDHVDISAFDGLDADVLAGFFAMPDRAKEWHFVRTPIQVPLNAIVLWRDLFSFVEHVLPRYRQRQEDYTPEVFVEILNDAFWKPTRGETAEWRCPTHAKGLINIQRHLLPLTVFNEAGRAYVKSALAFEDADLAKRDGRDHDLDPVALQQWLMAESERFQAAVRESKPSVSGPRIPVLVLDELTCLRVLGAPADGWQNTDPVFLSNPREDVLSDAPTRPRFNVTIAVKMPGQGAEDEFLTTRVALEEMLWSNTSVVAGAYADLFYKLQGLLNAGRNGDRARSLAGLSALRWLSLELSASEREMLLSDAPEPVSGWRSWSNPTRHGSAAWEDILVGAKSIILSQPEMRQHLKYELDSLSAVSAPAGASNK